MKRKLLNSMRVFLVAAGLCVGVNASWADEVEFTQVASYNFTTDGATDPFTNQTWSNRQTSTLEDDATLGTKAVVFKGSNLSGKTSGYHTLDFTSLTGSSSQVKVEFDFYVNSSNCDRFALRDASIAAEPTKDIWTGTGAIFSIGAARVSGTNYFGRNGKAISGSAFATPYHVSIIVDVVNKKVSYTLKKISDGSTVASESDLAFSDANATACTRLDFHGSNNTTMAAINNIVISEYTSSSATTYSVVKYDKDGNEIASTSGLVGVAGETSNASDADKANFYSADTNSKYVFDATDERNVTSLELTSTEATNVLKLYFDTYTKQTCTVKATDGTNDLGTIASGSFYSDEASLTLYWSKFINVDGTWYETEADPTTYYGHTFTATGDHSVTYTANPDVIYFAEWNSICARSYNNWFGERASGGNATILANSSTSTNTAATTATIAGGQVVDIYVSGYSCRGDATYTKVFYLTDGTTDTEIGRLTFTEDAFNTQVIKNVYIASDAKIKTVIASGNDHFAGDYIYVKKVTYQPVTVTDAGMATYVPSYDLDFSATAIKAYKAEVTGQGVCTLTEVANVPAGTPVLLVKDGGATESIPVMTGAATVTGNDLVAGTGAAVATSDGEGNTNMILNNGTKGIGFYFANGQTVAANRAYLHFASSYAPSASAPMMLVFADDVVTGINTVNGSAVKANGSEGFYNLSGQRVAKPTRGLYIVNGKKVVVK